MPETVFRAVEEKLSRVSEQYLSADHAYVFARERAAQTRLFFLILCALTAGFFLLLTVLLFGELLAVRHATVVMLVIVLSLVMVLALVDIVHDHVVRRPRSLARMRRVRDVYAQQCRALIRYTQGEIDEQGIRLMYEGVTVYDDAPKESPLIMILDWCLYTILFFGIGLFFFFLFW